MHSFRVLCIAVVVLFHTASIAGNGIPSLMGYLFPIAAVMDCFFFLTAFFTTSTVLREVNGIKLTPILTFLKKRYLRLLPSYYLCLFVLVLAQAGKMNWHHFTRELFLLTNAPYDVTPGTYYMPWSWTISIQAQYYLLAPLLVGLLATSERKTRVGLIAVICAASVGLRALGATEIHSDQIFTSFLMRLDTFALGVGFSLLLFDGNKPLRRWHESKGLSLLSLALALTLLCSSGFLLGYHHDLMFIGMGALPALGAAFTVLWLSHPEVERTVLGWGGFRLLATLSYGVYLVHIPLIYLLKAVVGPPGGGVALFFLFLAGWVLANGVAFLLLRAVEQLERYVQRTIASLRPRSPGLLRAFSPRKKTSQAGLD